MISELGWSVCRVISYKKFIRSSQVYKVGYKLLRLVLHDSKTWLIWLYLLHLFPFAY